jgi:hypothetical protein
MIANTASKNLLQTRPLLDINVQDLSILYAVHLFTIQRMDKITSKTSCLAVFSKDHHITAKVKKNNFEETAQRNCYLP